MKTQKNFAYEGLPTRLNKTLQIHSVAHTGHFSGINYKIVIKYLLIIS